MRNDFESNYLAHHGILGMKWGRKNGPPYPLGASDHSAAEKKAGWRKSLGGGRNESLYDRKITRLERAAAASKRDADDLRKAGYKQEADAVQKVSDKNKAKADKVRQLKADNNGRMTKGQKVVVGVASAAALKSVIDTGRNVTTANAMLDGFTKIPLTTAVGKGAVQAGKVAAVAALATYGGVKLYKYMKSPEREQKKFDKIKEKTKKLSDKVDAGADMDTLQKYRKQEQKYYKALNELQGKYEMKNHAGVNEFADYRISGKKSEKSSNKEEYGNLGKATQEYIMANDPRKKKKRS